MNTKKQVPNNSVCQKHFSYVFITLAFSLSLLDGDNTKTIAARYSVSPLFEYYNRTQECVINVGMIHLYMHVLDGYGSRVFIMIRRESELVVWLRVRAHSVINSSYCNHPLTLGLLSSQQLIVVIFPTGHYLNNRVGLRKEIIFFTFFLFLSVVQWRIVM